MSVANSTNYASVKDGGGGAVPIMQWATLDSDQFNRTHVADTAQTVEWHVHGGKAQGTGLSVLNLNSSASTNTALTNAGDVLITASHFTYNDGSNVAHTVAQLDGTNTFTGTLIVPVSAGAAPTTSGSIAYNSTNNTFVAGVNGSTQTLLTLGGGSSVGVANGGTGRATITAHAVIVGEGTSAVGMIGPGTTNTVLHGSTGADPSFSQVTGSDIATGTITATNLAAGSVTAVSLGLGAASAINGNATTTSTTPVSLGITSNITTSGGDFYVTAAGELGGAGGNPGDLYVFQGSEGIARFLCGGNGAGAMGLAGVWRWSGGSFGAGTYSITLYGSSPNGTSMNFNPMGFIAFEVV